MKEVILKDYSFEHYNKTVEWLNLPDIKKEFGVINLVTLESHKKWMENIRNVVIKAIYIDGKYIGNILLHLDLNHNSGFFQIYIGENLERGKGFAKIAIHKALQEFFDIFKLNRIWLKVFSDNTVALHIYKTLGFVKEGEERESFNFNGSYKNQLIFSILRKEWDIK